MKEKKLLKNTSLGKIRERINAIRKIDLKNTDIDFLKKRLEPLFLGYALGSPIINSGTILYRGRKFFCETEKPDQISEITYPNPQNVMNLGRVNRPGQAMFYSSIAREAPFFEQRVVEGDHIAISHWEVKRNFLVNNAGYTKKVFDRLGSARKDKRFWQLASNCVVQDKSLVHDFFSEVFTRDVAEGEEYNYKLSIAIGERLTSGNINVSGIVNQGDIPERFGGIIYPALAMKGNADNFALFPDFVDEYLTLKKVEWIHIDKVSDPLLYDVTVFDFANTFSAEGVIEWKGRHPNWELGPGEEVEVSVENGKWVCRNKEGKIIEPD